MTPTLEEDDRQNCSLGLTTKVPPARLDTAESDRMLLRLLIASQEQAEVLLKLIGTELHEHQLTKRGLKDVHLAQNRDVPFWH